MFSFSIELSFKTFARWFLYGLGFFGEERCFDGCLVCFVTGKNVCFFVTSLDDMAICFISVVVVSAAFQAW